MGCSPRRCKGGCLRLHSSLSVYREQEYRNPKTARIHKLLVFTSKYLKNCFNKLVVVNAIRNSASFSNISPI